jgi:hypothetical protein
MSGGHFPHDAYDDDDDDTDLEQDGEGEEGEEPCTHQGFVTLRHSQKVRR